jgi:hypothetical protein
VYTEGNAVEGAKLGVEVDRVAVGGVVGGSGGGSAEATGVEVDSVDSTDPVGVVVPTVRVKLAVTIW